jgi:hypothetical protein
MGNVPAPAPTGGTGGSGGGGLGGNAGTTGAAGGTNTGGGGGGGGGNPCVAGGAGGSGIVIVSAPGVISLPASGHCNVNTISRNRERGHLQQQFK